MKRQHGMLALLPLIALLGPSTVSADPVTININSLGAGVYNLNSTFNTNAEPIYFAGTFNTTYTNSANQTSINFDSYCIDLYHNFSVPASWAATTSATFNGNTGPTIAGHNAGSNGGYLATLYNTFDASATKPLTNIQAAGLQVALWSVEYNGLVATNKNGNNFFFDTDNSTDDQSLVYTQANADINIVKSLGMSSATFLMAIHNPTGNAQDLIGPNSATFNSLLVPEPGSFALMLAGLGLVVIRFRTARRVSSIG